MHFNMLLLACALFFVISSPAASAFTLFDVNPCRWTASLFTYYVPISDSVPSSKYIQCDPWGESTYKYCEEGHFFDGVSSTCICKDTLAAMRTAFGNVTDKDGCYNGGVRKSLIFDLYVCDCFSTGYSGEHCEKPLSTTYGISSEIVNKNFSLSEYVRDYLSKNESTFDLDSPAVRNMTNSTRMLLDNYLSIYKNGTLRYDTILDSLIDSITSDIYPDVFYFYRMFSTLSSNLTRTDAHIALIRYIPSLLSYTKYSFERYDQVFGHYQVTLNALGTYLSSAYANITRDATLYTNFTLAWYNETRNWNLSSTDDWHSKLSNYFSADNRLSHGFFNDLLSFQNAVFLANNNIMNQNNEFSLYSVSRYFATHMNETLRLIGNIEESSARIYGSLRHQAFWYLTGSFVQTA